MKKYSGAYIIAFHFSSDINDVTENRYKPTLLNPAVYTIGDDYFCCPAAGRKPPVKDRDGDDTGFIWKPIGEHYGRTVYRSSLEDMIAADKS